MKLTEKYQEALVYALNKHGDQVRKGPGPAIPYFSHLIAVSSIVIENGGNETQAIAGLLHDTVEDQGGKEARTEIIQKFGQAVADIVDECTDNDITPKPAWKPRKVAHLEKMTNASKAALLVILADKLHNARSILRDYQLTGEMVWDKFNGGRDDTLWYYRELSWLFNTNEYPFLTSQYRLTLIEIETLTGESPEQIKSY